MLETRPQIAFGLMNLMTSYIQEMQARYRELATERVEQRVANALIRLAGQSGTKSSKEAGIELFFSRQDVAEMTGSTLYTISRLRMRYAAAAGWAIFLTGQIALIIPGVFALPDQRFGFILAYAFIFFGNLMGMLAAAYSEQAFRRDFSQQRQIAAEHERAERLLLNILPASVAERLKRHEQVADHFDQASVLFADLVDFTPLSAGQPPGEVVTLLNEVFSAFDTLTEKYGLEKIKTIGDCYMVVSGIPQPRPDHAVALAEMALEMHAAIAHLRPLCLRIGINSGPIVAGVVGLKKFIYDLWGDTVNVASRMESNGLPGRIQVTEATYELLRDHYTFTDRGEIPIKGKGPMRVYLLEGRRG